jgi:hypothetical protein
MHEYLLFTIRNHRICRNLALILFLIFIFTPFCSAQDEGISIHGDFFSGTFVYGFSQNYDHPGNFLLGGQYNYPVAPRVELNGGFDLLWVELYGQINNLNKEVEVFIPFVTGGAALNFDEWRIFGKIGYSLAGSVNNIGSGKGWVSSILDFKMGSLQFGIKCPIYNSLSLSTSASYYFGRRIQIESNHVIFSSINMGLSYNLFNPAPIPAAITEGVDEYKSKYLAAQSENTVLFKQIVELHDKIKALSSTADKVEAIEKPADIPAESPEIPIEKISVDSLNIAYNLHIGQRLNIKDFVNKKGLKDIGKLILAEYNNIASSVKGLPTGIYFICTVPDSKLFSKNELEFPRIKFLSDPSNKNNLRINIDKEATELNNKIKLEIK